ncbi:MAG: gliding motility-associated C-terminal domain-containing protein [Bacteroidota bacterium]
MNKQKGYLIQLFCLLGMLLFSEFVAIYAQLPTPDITANNPVCENATLKLASPFQDGVIYHWYDLQGNEISVVATATVPDMQLNMAGIYRLVIEENGLFSDTATINIAVAPRPNTPTVFSNGPLCEGETLELESPNIPNTTYKWIDPFGTVIANTADHTILNMPKELAGDYFLEITQAGCASPLGGTEVGVIAVNEIPELTVDGPACEGDSLLVRGPRIAGVNYNWRGPNGFTSNEADSLWLKNLSVANAGEYTLFLEAEGCRSPDGTTTVDVLAKPTATLTGGGILCEDDTTNVLVTVTGKAPFELVYAINGGEQLPINTSRRKITLPANSDQQAAYSLVRMRDENGCPANLSGSAAVSVVPKPSIRLMQDTLCTTTNEQYQIQTIVSGGVPPYRFAGIDGDLVDSVFTSNFLPSGTAYTIQIVDANNCLSEQITGRHSCACSSFSGTVDVTPTQICGAETATILFNNDANLDANDRLLFVLHDAATGLGNIFATSETPDFEWTDNLSTNQTYYVSPVVGNPLGSEIDWKDDCLSVGEGTPLTFLPIPDQLSISGTQSICPGTVLRLTTQDAGSGAIYQWQTPIDIIETTIPELFIDPVESDYTGDFVVSVKKEVCVSRLSNPFSVVVAIPSGQASAGRDTVSCGNSIFFLDAEVPEFGFGKWRVESGAFVEEPNNPKSRVITLQEGKNIFYWTLSTEDCPNYEVDSVNIAYRPNALALNDTYTLPADQVVFDFNVKNNDVAPEGHTIWIEQFTEPNAGEVEHLGDGNFTYRRPFTGFKGNVVFDYLLCFETPTCPTQCDTGAVIIDVLLDPKDPGVYVPDGITPNNDGVNDRLVIEGLNNYEQNELIIFDRWGNTVFHASPYKNGWDGTYNDAGLPEGAYYYVLKTDVTDKRTLKGRVYIIR